MNKTANSHFKEQLRHDACHDCPRLVARKHSWKQMLALTACIMGVLVVLSVALVVILTRLYPY